MDGKAKSGRFAGVGAIVRYNWPQYVIAAVVVAAGVVVWPLPLPAWVRWAATAAACTAGWFAVASLVASYWVYDVARVAHWDWLPGLFSTPPSTWVHVYAGARETEAPLAALFPGSRGEVLDIYDPKTMTEPSIERARRASRFAGRPASADALPAGDESADAAFLLMVAHEVRSAGGRESLFGEVRRVLRPGGRAVVVEHLRDWANAAVFGPGACHFLPRREWRRLAAGAGLAVLDERHLTPFVRVFVLGRVGDAAPGTSRGDGRGSE